MVIILVSGGAAVAVCFGYKMVTRARAAVTGTARMTPGSFRHRSATSSTGTAPVFILGDATVPSGEITSTMPADASQGHHTFQVATGTVTLSNFYTTAQGYWPPLDALVLADDYATYTTDITATAAASASILP